MSNDRFKFRVWDKENKEYLQEGALLDSRTGNVAGYFDGDIFTIEQCTGLRDRNGKLIYEGDVVLFVGKVNLAVQYTPNEWEMAGDDVNVPLTENTARFVKIVGNIHEVKE